MTVTHVDATHPAPDHLDQVLDDLRPGASQLRTSSSTRAVVSWSRQR